MKTYTSNARELDSRTNGASYLHNYGDDMAPSHQNQPQRALLLFDARPQDRVRDILDKIWMRLQVGEVRLDNDAWKKLQGGHEFTRRNGEVMVRVFALRNIPMSSHGGGRFAESPRKKLTLASGCSAVGRYIRGGNTIVDSDSSSRKGNTVGRPSQGRFMELYAAENSRKRHLARPTVSRTLI